jgi:hypothetical protein
MARGMKDTPRSAPTQAFESAALAPTEQTEVARRPRGRQLAIAAAAIVLVATAFVVRGSGDDGDAAVAPAGNGAAPAPPTPAQVVAPVPAPVATKPVVPDSATLARRLAERQRRDSIRAATRAATAAAAAAAKRETAAPGSVESAIARYARAIEEKSVDKLKEAYPGLTGDQQKFWETNVFSRATKIRASVADLTTTMDRDDAQADFRLNVTFDYDDAQKGSIAPQQQHATLSRTPTGWQIVSIR